MIETWLLYVLKCNDSTLYCGITNNLPRRIKAHNDGKGAKYTRNRGPVELVFVDVYLGKSEALKAEYAFKQLDRKDKVAQMAKNLTQHQKGIVKRYYEHKDDINSQKLGELVSDLYLNKSPINQKRLWASTETALVSLVGDKPEMLKKANQIIKDRNLEELAKFIGEIF